jgi:hypothetical protein
VWGSYGQTEWASPRQSQPKVTATGCSWCMHQNLLARKYPFCKFILRSYSVFLKPHSEKFDKRVNGYIHTHTHTHTHILVLQIICARSSSMYIEHYWAFTYIYIYELMLSVHATWSRTDCLQNKHQPFKNGVSLLSMFLEWCLCRKAVQLILRHLKNELQLSLPLKGVFLLKYSLAGQLNNFLQKNIK